MRRSQYRDIGAKSTAKNVLGNINKSLKRGDLDMLQGPRDMNMTFSEHSGGRSMKSEFDYGSKRKFVDILGNVNKKNTLTMEQLDGKKGDTTSQRSRYSQYSTLSAKHRRNKTINMTATDRLEDIDEQDEIKLIDGSGAVMELNGDQLEYLRSLARRQVEDARNNREVSNSELQDKEELNHLMLKLQIGEGLTPE